MLKTILAVIFLVSCSSFETARTRPFYKSAYTETDILNKKLETVSMMLGEPHFIRNDEPVQILVYERETGTLFVFVENSKEKASTIVYIEARDIKTDEKTDVNEFLKRYF